MKNALIAGAMFAALSAGSAMAADMSVKAPILKAPPMPVFTWTGCYIAGGGGYGLFNQDTYRESDPGHVQNSQTQTGGGRGWFGGGQFGCDYQIATSWVIGAQVDFDWSNLNGTTDIQTNSLINETNDWTWATGGRIGYLVLPQLLTYFSGGYTEAHFNQAQLLDFVTGVGGNLYIPANTYTGYYLGTGYEYGLSFLPGLFWKTEYRYSSFGAADLSHINITTGLSDGSASNSKKVIQTIRSELVWRFNLMH
jgi:outer membrane immunogenic protein